MKFKYEISILLLLLLSVNEASAARIFTYDWRTACVTDVQFQFYAMKLTPLAYIEKGVTNPLSANEKTRAAYKRVYDILEYYRSVFNWDSINNAGATIHLHTNLWSRGNRGCNGLNAFYVPINRNNHVISILLGHSDTNLHMAMDADVIGHEFTHGVYATTQSNSFQTQERRALSESVSDMLGITFKAWLWANKDMNKLVMPKELYKIGKNAGRIAPYYGINFPGGVMRNMADPSQQGDPDHVSAVVPNHEIHSWAGVTNLAYYLLAEGGRHPKGKTKFYVKGIGLKKASHLVFYTLRHRLRFTDMRSFARAMKKAARKVYGNNSTEMIATHNAFAAVGLFNAAMGAIPQPEPQTKTASKSGSVPKSKPKPELQEIPEPAPRPKTKKKQKPVPQLPIPQQQETEAPPSSVSSRLTLSGTTFVIIFVAMLAMLILTMLVISRSKSKPLKQNRQKIQNEKISPVNQETYAIRDVSSLPTDVITPNRSNSVTEVSCTLIVTGKSFGLTLDENPICLGRMSSGLPSELLYILSSDETMSRNHCNIWYQAATDQLHIECLSGNGMSIDSVMLHKNERHSLTFNKDIQLKIGSTKLVFSRT